MSPTVVFCCCLGEFICISESPLRYAYTTDDDANLKIVAAQLWRNPEHLAQQETPQVYKLLLQIDWPWRQGWTRKELWESLVHDGFNVNYKQDLYCLPYSSSTLRYRSSSRYAGTQKRKS